MKQDVASLNRGRIELAERIEEPDQVPVYLWFESGFNASFAGMREREYHTNRASMLKAQVAVDRRFYKLPGVGPDFGIATWPSAFGCKIKWPEDGPPWVEEPLVRSAEDIERLDVPDPHKDGLMPLWLQTYEYMSKELRSDISYCLGGTLGPFDLASLIRGPTQFMIDLYRNPQLAHRLLELCTDTCVEWLRAHERIAGKLRRVFIGDDFPGFLSPDCFTKFVVPYTRRIFESFPISTRWYHCDGDFRLSTLALLKAIEIDVLCCFSPKVNIEKAKNLIGDSICLVGNVPPRDVLLRGTRSEVGYLCEKCIMKAAPGGGYVLSSGGVIDVGTPPENIDVMIRSSVAAGKYPVRTISEIPS